MVKINLSRVIKTKQTETEPKVTIAAIYLEGDQKPGAVIGYDTTEPRFFYMNEKQVEKVKMLIRELEQEAEEY